MSLPLLLESRLADIREKGLERKLTLSQGIDFSSNDYLGFAHDPLLRERIHRRVHDLPVGSTGSRLLTGNSRSLLEAEDVLRDFCNRKAALIYPSGYQANIGLLSSLLRRGDLVYSDELNHASMIDGMRLSGAEKRVHRHCDLDHLEFLISEDQNPHHGFRVIVTESIFSMEGTLAPLRKLAELGARHGIPLIVDEAHATAIYGSGRVEAEGLSDHVLATIHTGGKALGVAGAWIACSERLKEYLVHFSRSQIFSTASSPWIGVALSEAVSFWREAGKDRAEQVLSNIRLLSGHPSWGAPIFPWIYGSAPNAIGQAAKLREMGFDVRAIRAPSVPEGSARLRLTCPWGRTTAEIHCLRKELCS
jgi:8-amino-7-oxononanoate synthase